MKKKSVMTSLLLLFAFSFVLKADFNQDNKNFKKEMLQGNISFGTGNYDGALKHYSKAREIREASSILKKYSTFSNSKDGWDFWLSLVKKRKSMRVINPVATHKVLGIFINHTDTKFFDKKGKLVYMKSSIPDDQRKYILYEQAVTKRMIEVYSLGEWTVNFKNISLNATVTEVTNDEYKRNEFETIMRYPVMEKIKPFEVFRSALRDHIDKYDTIVLYWSGKGVAIAAGGGPQKFPLVRYQLYAPLRGWAALSIGSAHGYYPEDVWSYTVLFHEFFHCIQHLACQYSKETCIKNHEFTKAFRYKVPQWKGDGELSYYQYRFSKTLAQTGWKPLSFLTKYPMHINKKQIEKNIQAVSGITLVRLKRSYELSNKALIEKNQKNRLFLVNQSLKLNPVNPKALKMKIDLLSTEKDFRDIDKMYRTYLPLMSHDHLMYYKYALLLAQNKNYIKAILHFTTAIELAPESEYYYLNRGGAFRELKKYDKSIADFTKAISINNKNAWHFYSRAITYQTKGDYKTAIVDHNRAIMLDSKNEWFYYNRGNCNVSLKKYTLALKDFKSALEINPKNHWVLFAKGNLYYYHLHNKKQGMDEIRHAAGLGNSTAKEILKNLK